MNGLGVNTGCEDVVLLLTIAGASLTRESDTVSHWKASAPPK